MTLLFSTIRLSFVRPFYAGASPLASQGRLKFRVLYHHTRGKQQIANPHKDKLIVLDACVRRILQPNPICDRIYS